MTRRDQIKEAASKHARGWNPTLEVNSLRLHDSLMYRNFISGAEWSDLNPLKPYEAFRAESDEIIMKLQKKLSVAVAALMYYSRKESVSPDRSSPDFNSVAYEALEKIESMK